MKTDECSQVTKVVKQHTLGFMMNSRFRRFPHEDGRNARRFRPLLYMIVHFIDLCLDGVQFGDDRFERRSTEIGFEGFYESIFVVLLDTRERGATVSEDVRG